MAANVRKRSMSCIQLLVRYFFVIYVESQNKSVFLTLDQVQHEANLIQLDQRQCQERIAENEQQIKMLASHEVKE
jgi:hypothetical protein